MGSTGEGTTGEQEQKLLIDMKGIKGVGCLHEADPETLEYDKTFGRRVRCKKCRAWLVMNPRSVRPRTRPKMSKKERLRQRRTRT